ncbi:MAG: hypothetical protein JNL42_18315 [Anaerolineae bacterium]|nr:hypothetical protein [Anaerolineae bacterium]
MSSHVPSDPARASSAPILTPTQTGTLFIIAGPAGAGKNRLMQAVTQGGLAHQVPTATTRGMRPGEAQGREHLFVSHAEFERMRADGELVEWQEIHHNLYGMHRPTLEAALNAGENVIADIDIYGAKAARAALPDQVVTVFVQTPTIADLIDRMRMRGESTASIALRLLRVGSELEFAQESDAVITNDAVEHASDKLVTIVRAVLDDGRSNAACDPIIHYRYALHARAIPVCGGEALARRRAPEYPVVEIADNEAPAQAAHRALADTEALRGIGLPAPAEEGAFRAPLMIDHRRDEDGVEIVTYTYLVPLAEQTAPPEGWHWTTVTP